LAEFFGVKDGALIRSVLNGSPAEKAGLKAGDVILKLDDQKITGPKDISGALRPARNRKTVSVTLMRNHKEMTGTITLEERSSLRGSDRAIRLERFEL